MPSSLPIPACLPRAPGPASSQEHWGKWEEAEEGWVQWAVCALSPCCTGLARPRKPGFWQISDNAYPGSVSKGGLQKLEWQMYTKKNSNPHENASKTTSLPLDSSLTTGRVLATGGSPCSWPAALTPAASRSLGGPLQHPGRFPRRRTPRTGTARTGVTPLPASGLCFVPSTSAGLTSSSRQWVQLIGEQREGGFALPGAPVAQQPWGQGGSFPAAGHGRASGSAPPALQPASLWVASHRICCISTQVHNVLLVSIWQRSPFSSYDF